MHGGNRIYLIASSSSSNLSPVLCAYAYSTWHFLLYYSRIIKHFPDHWIRALCATLFTSLFLWHVRDISWGGNLIISGIFQRGDRKKKMPVKRYDWSSGQVYTERVIPSLGFANFKGPAWAHESPFLPVGWEEGSPEGANPLKHMAMRQTLSDQRRLTLEHFTHIPWPLARYIWECLARW